MHPQQIADLEAAHRGARYLLKHVVAGILKIFDRDAESLFQLRQLVGKLLLQLAAVAAVVVLLREDVAVADDRKVVTRYVNIGSFARCGVGGRRGRIRRVAARVGRRRPVRRYGGVARLIVVAAGGEQCRHHHNYKQQRQESCTLFHVVSSIIQFQNNVSCL